MKLVNDRIMAMSAGAALCALLASASARAEDVELFIGNVQGSNQAQPNIMLILDDSGSMAADVESQIDYDPSVTYDGTCDPNRVYWVQSGGWWQQPEPPTSSECGSTSRWVALSSFVCEKALNAFNAVDGGVYTDTMGQYHPGSGWSGNRWGDIDNDYNTRIVECQDDYGSHGDGSSASEVYPQNGDASNLWSSNSSDGINWGGWFGTGETYTVYHGNYVNWVNGPGASSTRLEIMQEVASNLINSVSGVNIGLMTFNDEHGGLVRHAIEDVSMARSSLISEVNSLTADNWTPLSETLYEAHQYFTGRAVDYGGSGDPDARDPNDSDRYSSPIEYSCQRNHIVLLTDGEPTRDWGANSEIQSLQDSQGDSFADLTGNATCDIETYPAELDPDGGVCLDDLAAFMQEGDLTNRDGQQNVTTHTVGFLIDLPVLEETAARGGGDYYTADDTGSLTSALTSIVSNILETQSTFVAPAVSVNAFNQTRNLNDLYFSVFQPSDTAHWPGNLKKYELNTNGEIVDANDNLAVDQSTGFFAQTSRSFWSDMVDGPEVELGGAAHEIPTSRSVYTYLGSSASLTASSNRVQTSNTSITDAMLNTGASGAPTRDQVIAYMNGIDSSDVDNDGDTAEAHNRMGDPLHSRPATVIYGPTNDDGRIYFATNDGYLHSIDTETGLEEWAFVPPEFLGQQVDIFTDNVTANKLYGIDGNIALQTVTDHDNVVETGEKIYLFFGMRRGGDFYYALDVSNPDQPQVMWRLDSTDLPGLGQSWSTPVPARIDIAGVTQNSDDLVLVFGGGYDTSQDTAAASADAAGNAVYIVDSESGNLLWHASSANADLNLSTATGSNATMEYSIPADVKVVDINSDGYADRIYAADMGGQVWRFDVFNGNPASSLVTGGAIAQLGAAGTSSPTLAQTRRFYSAPDTAFVSTGSETFMHVGIGSGYRSHPNSLDHADRFYAIRDYAAFVWRTQSEFDALTPHADSDFVDATSDINASVPSGSAGWKMELLTGEKVLAEAVTFDGEVFFSTFRPGSTGTGCNPSLGVNRQYRVSLYNASPVTNLDGEVDADNDGEPDPFTSGDRFTEDDGSILSRTTVIFVDDSSNGSGGTTVVGITETDSTNLDFDTSPRRTFWTQDSVD